MFLSETSGGVFSNLEPNNWRLLPLNKLSSKLVAEQGAWELLQELHMASIEDRTKKLALREFSRFQTEGSLLCARALITGLTPEKEEKSRRATLIHIDQKRALLFPSQHMPPSDDRLFGWIASGTFKKLKGALLITDEKADLVVKVVVLASSLKGQNEAFQRTTEHFYELYSRLYSETEPESGFISLNLPGCIPLEVVPYYQIKRHHSWIKWIASQIAASCQDSSELGKRKHLQIMPLSPLGDLDYYKRRLNFEQKLRITKQMLLHAHTLFEQRIVHIDGKLNNYLILEEFPNTFSVVFCDLDSLRYFSEDQSELEIQDLGLFYPSPESTHRSTKKLSFEEVRNDAIWTLGVALLSFWGAGDKSFQKKESMPTYFSSQSSLTPEVEGVLQKRVTGEIVRQAASSSIPYSERQAGGILELLKGLLSVNPEARYETFLQAQQKYSQTP